MSRKIKISAGDNWPAGEVKLAGKKSFQLEIINAQNWPSVA